MSLRNLFHREEKEKKQFPLRLCMRHRRQEISRPTFPFSCRLIACRAIKPAALS